MRSQLLKRALRVVSVALVSAVAGVLTAGVTTAQAGTVYVHGPSGAGQGTSIGLVVSTVALGVFVIGGVLSATLVDRRRLASATGGEVVRLPEGETTSEQERKAA